MLKRKYILSAVVSLLLVGCSNGDNYASMDVNSSASTPDNNGSNENNQDIKTSIVSGKVIDGYIKNANVCLDLNNNNSCDEDEPSTKTDNNGNFEFEIAQSGTILAYGGVDLSTRLPFEGVLKAPSDSKNITPLTTLLNELISNGKSKDEALNDIAMILDIDKKSIEEDPIVKLIDRDDTLLKANLKLEKTIEALSNTKDDFLKTLENIAKVINNKKANSFEDLIDGIVKDETRKESLKEITKFIDSAQLDEENHDDLATILEYVKNKVKNGEKVSSQDLEKNLSSCQIDPNLDDSTFVDTPPNGGENINYFTIGESVSDIEAAFNYARSFDSTVNGKKLSLPSQDIWNKMAKEERALYILNRERVDRGLKPFEGVFEMNQALKDMRPKNPKTLADVAQGYTNLLYNSTTLSHTLDGSPSDRIERVSSVKNHKEFIPYNESLYAEGNSFKLSSIPLVKAIYNWIYADANVAEGKPWGHRAMCLMRVDNDDFGVKGAEGLLAFGLKQGDSSKIYPNFQTSIVTLNAINPLASFSGNYKKSKLCYGENSLDDRFIREKGLIEDTKTSLIWQDIDLSQGDLTQAKEYCEKLTLAGFDDWRLPKTTELANFYKDTLDAGVTPNLSQINITKMSADGGFILTAEGAKKYGMTLASITNDFPSTSIGDIRCVRGEDTSVTDATDSSATEENLVVDSSRDVVIDNSQDLMFENNSAIAGRFNIEYGKIACNNLTLGDFTDWRLPTPTELSTFHKNAFSESITLQYSSSYCTYEVTNDGAGNSYKAVRVQTSDDNYQIGDIVTFGSPAGVRCVRVNASQDNGVDTEPPARVAVDYAGSDKIDIALRDEDQLESLTYVQIDYDCDDSDSSHITCKDFSLTFTGEAGSKLYALESDGSLPDQEIGTLNDNGELTIDFEDSQRDYDEGINTKEGHFYDQLGSFVLVDEAGNISRINRVFVEFFVQE